MKTQQGKVYGIYIVIVMKSLL